MKALAYRAPANGSNYADWLRALKNQSGAYVIRSRQSGKVLYVGESHSGRLTETITRHFRQWVDKRGWFNPDGKHFTCDRHRVEVAVRLTPPNAAAGAQDNLIRRLQPSENVQGFEPDPF